MDPRLATAARSGSGAWIAAIVLPLLPTLGLALLGLGRSGSAAGFALVLGPWAGLPLGHEHCTMATQMPGTTIAMVCAAIGIAVGLLVVPRGWRRALGPFLVAVWLVGWLGLGMLSVINAAS